MIIITNTYKDDELHKLDYAIALRQSDGYYRNIWRHTELIDAQHTIRVLKSALPGVPIIVAPDSVDFSTEVVEELRAFHGDRLSYR